MTVINIFEEEGKDFERTEGTRGYRGSKSTGGDLI